MYVSHVMLRCRLLFAVAVYGVLLGNGTRAAGTQGPARPPERPAVKELFRSKSKGWAGVYALAPDGKTLAYAESYAQGSQRRCDLVLLDLDTGKELRRRQLDRGDLQGNLFSPDGKFLALTFCSPGRDTKGDDGRFGMIWDVARWQPKVKLRSLDGYRHAWPLAFSPDGKRVVGRAQRKVEQPLHLPVVGPFGGEGRVPAYDLVLWDADAGVPRLLKAKGAKFALSAPGGGSFYFVGPDGKPQERIPGEPVVGFDPVAAIFADQGRPESLFVQYRTGEGFTTAWNLAQGKPLASEMRRQELDYLSGSADDDDVLAGGGAPVPNSAFALCRYRLTPSGRIVQLPRYDVPPLLIVSEEPKPGEAMPVVLRVGVRPPPDRPFPGSFTELWRLKDFGGWQLILDGWRLSPDGRRLVTDAFTAHATDSQLRVWDLSALLPLATQKQDQLPAAECEKLWAKLFADPVLGVVAPYDAMALAAMGSLVRHGDEGVAWLRQRLGPPLDLRQVPRLIEALGSSSFAAREQATRELTKVAPVVRPLLERALRKDQPPEVKRRLESILDRLAPRPAVHEIRQLRIIDVLEHITTPAAREILQRFADGQYDPALTDEARRALQRATAKAKPAKRR